MLQIKKLNLTHKKDLRIILNDFNLVLNDGDKAVIIGVDIQSVACRKLYRSRWGKDNGTRTSWLSSAGDAR